MVFMDFVITIIGSMVRIGATTDNKIQNPKEDFPL
jgi:hypothetical protein